MLRVDALSFEQFIDAVKKGEPTLSQLITWAANQKLSVEQDVQLMEAAKLSTNQQHYQPFITQLEAWKKEHENPLVELLGARKDLKKSLENGSNLGGSWADYAPDYAPDAVRVKQGMTVLGLLHVNQAKPSALEAEQKAPSKTIQQTAPTTMGGWKWGLWKQEKPNPASPKIGAHSDKNETPKSEDTSTNNTPRK